MGELGAQARQWAPRTVVLIGCSLLLARGAAAAPAADDEDGLIKAGIERRKHQDDAAALELFKKAYGIRHGARAAAQMGLAEMALGQWVEADAHLAEAMDASGDRWVARNRSTLEEARAKVDAHVGNLELLGGPVGAEIVVDDVVRGRLPLERPLRVRVGEQQVTVRAAKYRSVTLTVQVSAAALTRETVHLVAALPEPPERPSDQPSRPTVGAVPVVVKAPAEDEPQRGSSALRTTGIVLAATGAAAIGAGIYFGLAARQAGIDNSRRDTYDASADSAGKLDHTLQYVGYAAGGALVAVGVTTYLLGREPRSELVIAPSNKGWLAGARVTF
jgi:hypothetical protein